MSNSISDDDPRQRSPLDMVFDPRREDDLVSTNAHFLHSIGATFQPDNQHHDPTTGSDDPSLDIDDNTTSTTQLDRTANTASRPKPEITWKGILAHMGPAFLISIGYLDPGNWATDVEGGSRFGYDLLWILILSNFMALLLQVLAARLGIVSQSHLAQCCRDEYPKSAAILLWFLAELAIVATDLTEVLGTAIGLNLVFAVPLVVGVVITALDTFLLLSAQNSGMKRLEQVMFAFLGIISICFIVELVFAKPSVHLIFKGIFVPKLTYDSLYVAIGIIGATVMPHNFYLHSAIVVNRVSDRSPDSLAAECKYNLIDSAVALNAAVFINMAILIISAANFWAKGINVITLQDAYHLLETVGIKIGPIEVAPLLFGLALIASGQSSTLCGTLAGQYVMEGFLQLTFPPVIRRLVTRVIAILPAVLVILITGDKGTYRLLIFAQVVLSLQLPFAMIPLIKFTSSTKRMGSFANSPLVSVASWFVAILTIGLNLFLVVDTMRSGLDGSSSAVKWITAVIVVPIATFLTGFLLWLVFRAETPPTTDQPGTAPIVHGQAEEQQVLLDSFK